MLTIMTPSYNRAHTLSEVYASLCAQTDQRFLWMVIDDGSSDGTQELVEGWVRDGVIPIEYYKKPNGGKGSALNVGIDHLKTELAACVDSDDPLFPDAVKTVLAQYAQIREEPQCCGILAYRSSRDGTPMGGRPIPEGWNTVTAADIFMRINSGGEIICFYKTACLKRFRFPEYPQENFFSPAWMQYQVSRDHYFAPCREALCLCEYRADGLTRDVRRVCAQNPHCYRDVKRLAFEFAQTVPQIVKHGVLYDTACILCRDRAWLKQAPRKGWALLLYPAAHLVYGMRFARYLRK